MGSEWVVSWLIALAVCTAYGWWQKRQGIILGSQTTANFMTQAITATGRMNAKQIAQACTKHWEKIRSGQQQDQQNDDEG